MGSTLSAVTRIMDELEEEEKGIVESGSAHQILSKRTREGHCQSDKPWNCFKGDVEETSERQGGAHMGLSKRLYTILN